MPSYKAGASEDRPEQVLFQVHLLPGSVQRCAPDEPTFENEPLVGENARSTKASASSACPPGPIAPATDRSSTSQAAAE